MTFFNVKVDKEEIDKDGFVDVRILDWELQDACRDSGGCCDHEDMSYKFFDDFEASLDHYFFRNNLEKGDLYNDIVELANSGREF